MSVCRVVKLNSKMFKQPNYVYGNSDQYIFATLNFGEYILKRLWLWKDRIALINGITNETIRYGDIAQEAMNVAVSLTQLGVRKGDVIAISSENRREYWGVVIGTICAGATVTTINLAYTKDELTHVINIAKPKYVFCSPYVYKNHAKSYKSLKFVKNLILFGEEKQPNTISYNDIAIGNNGINTGISVTKNANYEEFVCADVKGQIDTAFILYSSGTTGLPKGVMLSHVNVLAATVPLTDTPPSRGLSITPWYHSLGLISSLGGFVKGRTVVYLPKFDVDMYLRTVEKYKIESLTVVPAVLVALCKAKSHYDTSSVREVYSGAAPLYEETAKAVRERFPNALAIFQGYGLTESTMALTVNANTEKIGSVGTVADNVVLKVVHPETKKALGPNKEGEICAKGLIIMQGYVGKDRRADFDDEGFFRTGDLGYYDDEGYFYIVDRLKELIKYKGYQVPPAEIEAVLLKHSGIRDAAVVGLPDAAAEELPLAFVVLQPGVALTEREIQAYVAERLSNPKHLRGGVRFVNEIPKNQTGKILRKELRKLVRSGKSKL